MDKKIYLSIMAAIATVAAVWLVALLAAPIAKPFGDQVSHLLRIEIADDDDFGAGRAQEVRVQFAQICNRDAVDEVDVFLDRAHVAHVVARIVARPVAA